MPAPTAKKTAGSGYPLSRPKYVAPVPAVITNGQRTYESTRGHPR